MSELSNPNDWVEKHGAFLYRFALQRVRDSFIAEDLVQETFVAALKSRNNFKGLSSESTWLAAILKHKIMDHFRKAGKEVVGELPFEKEQPFRESGEWVDHWKENRGPQDWGVISEVESKELREKLSDCIQSLPARLADIFNLRELDGIGTKEICNELGITSTNLGVLLHRARGQLRRCLEQYWLSP